MTDLNVNITITSNLPGIGVSVEQTEPGQTVKEYLEGKGVNVEGATVMVNGEASTLDKVLGDGERLTVARDGKGAGLS